jgi:signal transduction histidine kinase
MADFIERSSLLRRAFPELGEVELDALCRVACERLYTEGSHFCRQGDAGKTLFILAEGEAGIFVRTGNDGQEIWVKSAQPGSYFGEMALLGNTTRSATVRALTACRTLEIDRETFVNLVEEQPALLHNLSRQIIDHLRNNDRAVITELRQKNEELATAYAHLAEQEKLRSQFIAILSHELRTPLTSAQGFLHLINKGVLPADSLRQALDLVTRNVEKMVALINNLLVLYEMRLTSHQATSVSLTDVVAEAVNEAKAMVNEKQAPVVLELIPDLPEIEGDRNGLILALRAVVENALKFSPDCRPVHVRIGAPRNGHVQIEVIDSGIGIPAEALEQIFEPFSRVEGAGASRLFPGLGVGLSIARFIIERHGGRIEVMSTPGRGTNISVFLSMNGG